MKQYVVSEYRYPITKLDGVVLQKTTRCTSLYRRPQLLQPLVVPKLFNPTLLSRSCTDPH